MVQKRLINADEIAQMLSISRGTLYHWVVQKRIPFVKIGRSTKFDIEVINEWIKKASVACKDYTSEN